jgi:hypothetical protein
MSFKFMLTLPLLLAVVWLKAQTPETPETLVVTPEKPLLVKDSALRTQVIAWSKAQQQSTNNKQIKAHPSACVFPGDVKSGAKPVTTMVRIKHEPISPKLRPIADRLVFSNPQSPTMYSTGLYAAPGAEITIALPDSLQSRSLAICIGAHTDELYVWGAETQDWRRMPAITKTQSVKGKALKIASPFGGLVYLVAARDAKAFNSQVKISGAIAAPYFKLGETTDEQWQAMLRDNKAPWGELASPNLIITIPDSVMQQIKDPVSAMKLWETIIQGEMELAQLPQPFYRAQRLVLDEHMCAGYMHSGYPIMIHHSPSQHMMSADIIADPKKLLTPSKGGANWGFFHELGHNMQNYDLVFDGTTEVSCNFFSLYMFDRLMGGRDGAHENVSNEYTMGVMKSYFADGARYEHWVQEPFLGLIMFRQLQESFGWETFKTFFRTYHDAALASPEMKEISEAEKRDQFVINFSKAAKRNLAPFFMKWGIPVSAYAAGELAQFETWMPYNYSSAN